MATAHDVPGAKPVRKAISQRTRFAIFKRDSFRCQYCGRAAPEVELQCDHRIPVIQGGGSEPANLVTACRDCNSGKSGIALDEAMLVHEKTAVENHTLYMVESEMPRPLRFSCKCGEHYMGNIADLHFYRRQPAMAVGLWCDDCPYCGGPDMTAGFGWLLLDGQKVDLAYGDREIEARGIVSFTAERARRRGHP
jgi:hypothetical protein